MFFSVFSRIGIIFIILLVGALARWRKLLSEQTTDGLCRIAIEVTLPFLYFYTLATSLNRTIFLSLWPLPLLAIGLTGVSLFFSWLFSARLKLNQKQRRTFIFLGTFGNYGFLAIPLAFALFQEQGLLWMSMFNLGISFLYWTLGVTILKGHTDKGIRIFRNLIHNATIALVLGLVVGLTSISLPRFFLETAQLIGGSSIPLALIVIGSFLAAQRRRIGYSVKIISALVFLRLIFIPLLVLLSLQMFDHLPAILTVIIILQAAMPSASTTPILTKRFDADAELAASGVFFTTLFSIVTVPFFISLAL
ncbi:MAG: AEC family transporter [Candidatus Omnitrophica bacterium]|nr:AEC family transporter [Candidatus Omnitrophota bacterium]